MNIKCMQSMTVVVCLRPMHAGHDRYFPIDAKTKCLMFACLGQCRLQVSHQVYHNWCRLVYGHISYLLPVGLGRCHMISDDACRLGMMFPTDTHTPLVNLARLGWCWWHWKTSFSTCAHATPNACRFWLMMPSWCAHTMFYACMPWVMSHYIDMHMFSNDA